MIYPYLQGTDTLHDRSVELAAVYRAQEESALLTMIQPEDFFDKDLRFIFRCMVPTGPVVNIMLTNQKIEDTTTESWMKGYGWLDSINKAEYRGPWEQIFINLRLLRMRREAKDFSSKAKDMAIPQEFIQMAEELSRLLPNDKDVQSVVADIGVPLKLLKTGYSLLDDNGGVPYGSVVVIASETGVGKTTMGINLMSRILQNNTPVHYVSLEMSSAMIAIKLLQVRHGVGAKIAVEARDQLMEFAGSLAMDDRKVQFPDILASMLSKSMFDVHIIDHLHIIDHGGNSKNRLAELEDMTRKFKTFAQTNNKVVILLCQLNRDISKSVRPPQLADLRGSGSIEQDADIVTMLHDPNRREEEAQPSSFVETIKKTAKVARELDGSVNPGDRLWYLRKNRHGAQCVKTLSFDPLTLIFDEKL